MLNSIKELYANKKNYDNTMYNGILNIFSIKDRKELYAFKMELRSLIKNIDHDEKDDDTIICILSSLLMVLTSGIIYTNIIGKYKQEMIVVSLFVILIACFTMFVIYFVRYIRCRHYRLYVYAYEILCDYLENIKR